jgi:1-acyl-sn-glycerol-3-phosphate acyltransferase
MGVAPLAFALSHRKTLCFSGRLIFRRRYNVKVDGMEALADGGKTYLVLPNHPAIVDPMLVCSELWRIPLRPLSDEMYVERGGISSVVLKTLDAVKVPDLRKHRSEAGAKIARGLNDVVTNALNEGRNVIFYPSGHIWTEPKEEIGTRQLAYNVAREILLREGTEGRREIAIIGIRTLGLWGSIWSRKDRKASPSFLPTFAKSIFLWLFYAPFAPRRKVSMHIEDLTGKMREWARLSRLEFNRKLEEWYNEGEMK